MWLNGRNPSIYLDAVKKRAIWVAEDKREQVIGFVEIDGFEVTKLFVAGGNAFHGAGKKLLQLAVSQIAVSGAAKVSLEATLTAVKFYEKYGFRIVGQGVFSRGSNAMNLEIVKMELDFEGAALPVEKLIEE
jgi:ribosomal protein S18 acetylase RimI-like enzyme